MNYMFSIGCTKISIGITTISIGIIKISIGRPRARPDIRHFAHPRADAQEKHYR